MRYLARLSESSRKGTLPCELSEGIGRNPLGKTYVSTVPISREAYSHLSFRPFPWRVLPARQVGRYLPRRVQRLVNAELPLQRDFFHSNQSEQKMVIEAYHVARELLVAELFDARQHAIWQRQALEVSVKRQKIPEVTKLNHILAQHMERQL